MNDKLEKERKIEQDPRNRIQNGLIIGLAVPLIFYFIWGWINGLLPSLIKSMKTGMSDQFIFILAALTNLIPFLLFNRWQMNNAMRGVLMSTLLLIFFWLIYYKFNLI